MDTWIESIKQENSASETTNAENDTECATQEISSLQSNEIQIEVGVGYVKCEISDEPDHESVNKNSTSKAGNCEGLAKDQNSDVISDEAESTSKQNECEIEFVNNCKSLEEETVNGTELPDLHTGQIVREISCEVEKEIEEVERSRSSGPDCRGADCESNLQAVVKVDPDSQKMYIRYLPGKPFLGNVGSVFQIKINLHTVGQLA